MARSPAATDCPLAGELRTAVERIVQRSIASSPGDRLIVDVQFLRGDSGFEAVVRLAGAKQGERRLTDTGGSCAPLEQAVAVTLALLVDLDPEPPEPMRPPARSPASAALPPASNG